MLVYTSSAFTSEAAELPKDLVDALTRDVGMSGEDYLADAEAAARAVEVVDSLEANGVDILGSRIDDGQLTVNVDSIQDANTAESAGARVEFGAPEELDLSGYDLSLTADIYSGQGYYWEDGKKGYQCSVGFNGYSTSTGDREMVTAGHCVQGMTNISGSVKALTFTRPGTVTSAGQIGASFGSPIMTSAAFGADAKGYDVARIAVSGSRIVTKPSVLTWGLGAGAPLSSPPKAITGQIPGIEGAMLCKSGSRTGWRCGKIVNVDNEANVDGVAVNSIIAEVCSLPGDSGGSAVVGTSAVGISSWTTLPGNSCTPPSGQRAYGGFFPMVSSGGASVKSRYGSSWELAVYVPSPSVTSGKSIPHDGSLVGKLDSSVSSSKVSLYLDGASEPFAVVSAASGSWEIPLPGVTSGPHGYRLIGSRGKWSTSDSTTGTLTVARPTGPAAISEIWEESGGETGPFGKSTSSAKTINANGGGAIQTFQNGDISWSAKTGAFGVLGPVADYYRSKGGPAGSLGWPAGDERTLALGDGGSVQGFQFAAVTSSMSGVFSIAGAIRSFYGANGGLGGPLGWPASDEKCTSGYCEQSFEGGRIFQSSSKGTSYVPADMVAAFDAAGGPSGSLGWPASRPSAVSANGGGTVQGFAGGAIVSSAAGAFVLVQPIRGAYGTFGGLSGQLGWPTSNQTCTTGASCTQTFTGGELVAPENGAPYIQ